ncbi:MAG: hypothetical protein LUG52_02455 [Clostridia bacterium]|nr:hypothetical protein [Clostridia bacterium]
MTEFEKDDAKLDEAKEAADAPQLSNSLIMEALMIMEDVTAPSLLEKTKAQYAALAPRIFEFYKEEHTYGGIRQYVHDMTPTVENINKKGIGDSAEVGAGDRVDRMLAMIGSLISEIDGSSRFKEAVSKTNAVISEYSEKESETRLVFASVVPPIMKHWLENHPKEAYTERQLRRFVKRLGKKTPVLPECEEAFLKAAHPKKHGCAITLIIIIVALAAAAAYMVFAPDDFSRFAHFVTDLVEPTEATEIVTEEETTEEETVEIYVEPSEPLSESYTEYTTDYSEAIE